jgi:phosphatidylserine/phosphatidylglycerophosphate/cardiolipin synthase-like enzyme
MLRPGVTCWRLEQARRVAVLVDGAAYFRAMKAAMENARQSILLLGWDFDPRVCLEPGGDAPDETFYDLMQRLLARNAVLRVHILIWDMALPFAIQRRHGPRWATRLMSGDRLEYRLDGTHPVGAAHHQKILVVDDSVAFCGGSDFTRNRWDTPAHLPADRRRRTPEGRIYAPRHDVVMAVDGAAAQALGSLMRARWLRATGVELQPPAAPGDAWPLDLKPDAQDVPVGIARTEPALQGRPEVREAEALHVAAIAAAKRWIYIENQYVTSESIGAALARRLAEPDGPEIIVVCPLHSGGIFDRLALDHARNALIHRLHKADRYGRFRAFAPLVGEDVAITVHSKLMIVDDRLLRVGSANLNNRSLGFDSECDLAIEAGPGDAPASGAVLRTLRRLLAEHTNSSAERVEQYIRGDGSVLAAIDALNPAHGRRLHDLRVDTPGLFDRLFGTTHLFDPLGVADNWRPWRRLARRLNAPRREER